MTGSNMLPAERRAVLFLVLIYAVRMIGLFMILPVFVLYAAELEDISPQLLGIALGIYGLTQGLLQIPYGMLSDRYGRKRLITIGLLVFAGGSLVAAQADSIYSMIAGRALQGAGAIAAVVMALTADLTRESQRSKAMAAIGISIGVSFLFSIILGPVVYSLVGGAGIFYVTAGLAVCAIGFLHWGIPKIQTVLPDRSETGNKALLPTVLNAGLLRIYSGIFILHAVLTANFVAIPVILRDTLKLPVAQHGWMYLLTMIAGICVMLPGLVYAEKYRHIKFAMVTAALLLAVSQVGMAMSYGYTLPGLAGLLFVFFAAFNYLEAVFPSLISKEVPVAHKGAALGMYSTSQFLGAFAGGILAGWALKTGGYHSIFIVSLVFSLLWLPAAFGMKITLNRDCYTAKFKPDDGKNTETLRQGLKSITGIREIKILENEGIVYVHVDNDTFDLAAFNKIMQQV